MFEHMTMDYIMERMLSNVDEEIDQREGSVIYDALMPCAIELANLYMEMDMVLNEGFADTASMEYLAKRAAERGILPRLATSAHVKGKFYGGQVPVGTRYSCNEMNYQVTEELSESEEGIFYYDLICEEPGSEANAIIGQLVPATPDDYVDGVQYVEIVDILIPGEDDEDQEIFRERYFASFEERAFGGNVADYKEKVNSLDGVGGVKVYPVWNGGGTVKLVIINSQFQRPSSELVETVQNIIDPAQDGGGTGLAPIGHVVTVEAVREKLIHVAVDMVYEEGYSFANVKGQVEESIEEYFRSIAREWAQSSSSVVRIAQIEYRLLGIEGIMDVSGTTLNGLEKNIILGENEIPVRGDVIG